MTPDDLDTPALLVDLDVFAENAGRIAAVCRAHGVRWRPHVKAVKAPALAARLLAAGASGLTCATLGEAETMAAAGLGPLLIANQVVGAAKVERLVALRRRADVTVAVDSTAGVGGLAAAATAAGVVLPVVVEVDVGLRRAGVAPGPPVVALAGVIARSSGLRLAGVMAWEGHTTAIADPAAKAAAVAAAVGALTASARECRRAGFAIDVVSCGGTGTYPLSAAQPGVTEIQAGGGVFGDRRYRARFGVAHPYALTVLSTVLSRPTPTRIVADAGRKAMSADADEPYPVGVGPVRSLVLSAEHATVELVAPAEKPAVGDRLRFVPGYCDTTVHLHDQLYGVRADRVEEVFALPSRRRP